MALKLWLSAGAFVALTTHLVLLRKQTNLAQVIFGERDSRLLGTKIVQLDVFFKEKKSSLDLAS
jgi:hypothetical protein